MNEFKSESIELIDQMIGILESCEAGESEPVSMENFGQLADRMMGGARQLDSSLGGGHAHLTSVARFTQLCKLLGYKASQLGSESPLWLLAVGVLLDASGELKILVGGLEESESKAVSAVNAALLDRLQWLNQQFDDNIDGSVPMSTGRIVDPIQVQALFDQLKNKT